MSPYMTYLRLFLCFHYITYFYITCILYFDLVPIVMGLPLAALRAAGAPLQDMLQKIKSCFLKDQDLLPSILPNKTSKGCG